MVCSEVGAARLCPDSRWVELGQKLSEIQVVRSWHVKGVGFTPASLPDSVPSKVKKPKPEL